MLSQARSALNAVRSGQLNSEQCSKNSRPPFNSTVEFLLLA